MMATHQQAEDRVHTGFWIHLACYIAVVSGLAILNYQRNPDNLWVLWVAGGWGIGIVAHAFAYFANRDRLINRVEGRMDRREARQDRREGRIDGREVPPMGPMV
jgi:hypothetical protein